MRVCQVYQTVSCDFTGSHLRMCLMGGMVSLVLLAFMVLVFWLVYVELPRRLEVFDVDFLRSSCFAAVMLSSHHKCIHRDSMWAVVPNKRQQHTH